MVASVNIENMGDWNGVMNHSRNSSLESIPDKKHLKVELYKTEMCRSFVERGYCPYGEKCQFAHGEHELRPVTRHPKYRTKKCKNFAETGVCTYGVRCRFIHERTVANPSELSNMLHSHDEKSERDKHQDNERHQRLPVFARFHVSTE
mmetsp:Transcript_7584/g.33831  ORF Transcript_7584/g.33831 Transcript_7584/m.33831 type:complete len:148 (+) Transcript_7584:114-557(+)